MGKVTFIVVTFMLLSCAGGGGDSQSDCASQLQYMGYYYGASLSFGDFIDDVYDHSNFVLIVSKNTNHIEHAISRGLKVLIGIPNAEPDIDFALPYIDHIIGIYLFDEPYIYHITYEEQNRRIEIARAKYGLPIWATLWWQSAGYHQIADFDVVSLTPHYNLWEAEDYRRQLRVLKTKLKHQKIAVTLDAYSVEDPTEEIQEYKADVIRDYVDMAICEGAVALFTFIYPTIGTGYGVQDMPIVKEELNGIFHRLF